MVEVLQKIGALKTLRVLARAPASKALSDSSIRKGRRGAVS
jgi:hypothetical protein